MVRVLVDCSSIVPPDPAVARRVCHSSVMPAGEVTGVGEWAHAWVSLGETTRRQGSSSWVSMLAGRRMGGKPKVASFFPRLTAAGTMLGVQMAQSSRLVEL